MKNLVAVIGLVISIHAFSTPFDSGIIRITTTEQADLMQFQLKMIDAENILVHVSGIEDEFGTLSLINSKGESIFFEFINNNQDNYYLNLANLTKGTYYVKLNANNEIRMKTLVVE